MEIQELKKQIYEKALAERTEFVEDLLKQPAEKILEEAYKKVIYDDILMLLEPNNDFLSDEQIKALSAVENPLNCCYSEWLDTEDSHMEELQYVIRACADFYALKRGEPK